MVKANTSRPDLQARTLFNHFNIDHIVLRLKLNFIA